MNRLVATSAYLTDDSGSVCIIVIYFRPIYLIYYSNWTWTMTLNNTTGVTCGAVNTYPSGAHEFTSCFCGVRVAHLQFYVFVNVEYCLYLSLIIIVWCKKDKQVLSPFVDIRFSITPAFHSTFLFLLFRGGQY